MMFAHEDGVAAEAPAVPVDVTPEVARRWQDATMAKFFGQGLSTRAIGALMNIHQSTVSRRLRAMPAEARAHFASSPRE